MNDEPAARDGAASEEAAPALSSEVLTGAGAYAALRSDWLLVKALQPSASVFQAPDFLSLWAEHFAKGPLDRTLKTIVVRQAGRPVLIWPLQVSRGRLAKVAVAAGRPFSQYDEFILDPRCSQGEATRAAYDRLMADVRPDILQFAQVRKDGALFRTLLADKQPISAEGAPYAEIGSDGFAGFMSRIKQKVGREQRRRLRLLGEQGEVRFEISGDSGTAADWLAMAIDMKRQWLTDTGKVSTTYMDERTNELFPALARSLGEATSPVRLAVARLTVSGEPAAYEVGLIDAGRYFLYLGTYSQRYAKFSTGNLLAQQAIEWCAENGIGVYDMMAPRSQHKSDWSTGEVEVFDYAIPTSRRGELYLDLVVRRLRPGMKRVFYSLPAPIRSAIAGRALRI